MSATVHALLAEGVERFEQAGLAFGHGTDNALDEAAWLILRSLGLPPGDIAPCLGRVLTAAEARAARALLARRVRTRKPAAYLLNEAWLGPYRFFVDERVLVPRSFIFELLGVRLHFPAADSSRDAARRKCNLTPRVLDLCTGSGCLAIVAAKTWPDAKVDAADLSADALAVANINVASYRLGRRVRLVESDLFGALAGRRYDLIVSNPPYVRAASMRRLPPEYRNEPEMALASGGDGLEHTRKIIAQARAHLNPGGRLMVEIGHNRKSLERAFPDLPFVWPRTSAGPGFVFTLLEHQLPA